MNYRLHRPLLLINVARSLRTFWVVAPRELVAYSLIAVLQVAASLSQVWLVGKVLNVLTDVVVRGNHIEHRLYQFAVLLVLATVVEQLSWALLTYFEKQGYQKWSRHNYKAFNEKISSFDVQQFDDVDMRNRINRLQQEGYAWKPVNFAFNILYCGHSLLRMSSTFVILASLMPLLIPILLLGSLPAMLAQKREADVSWGIWHTKSRQSNLFWRLGGLLQQRDSVMELRTIDARQTLLDEADTAIGSFLRSQRTVLRRYLKFTVGARLIEGFVIGGVNIWLIAKVIRSNGAFSIGQYSAYSGYAMQFQSSSSMVYRSIVDLLDGNRFMSELYGFLDSEPAIVEVPGAYKLPKGKLPEIVFERVGFTYPGEDRAVFKDLSLTIRPGEHIAIVGQNGAGKSTLVKLLLRFYDATEGRILLDGHDIKEVDLASWRYHVGALFQAFNHYPFSLEKNVTIGRPQAAKPKQRLKHAITEANAGSIIASLPMGYKTILDPTFENGTELSGGQWQKIALARAFYRDASMLILDEPTSAVDAKAEYEIFEQIRKNQADKTTLIVSHRFSTVRQAARIIVIEHGQIVEDGSHEQLMRLDSGKYRDMFTKQAEGYK